MPTIRSWFRAFVGVFGALAGLAQPAFAAADKTPARPNIVFILADDLGYGDIGPFGQKKIRTPTLDRLAAEGMKFTQHYAGNAVCAPSRCVLLTGLHPGHAFIRDNRGVKPEGQFPIPAETVTLPKLLRQAGYVTGAFGKWGLGAPGSTGEPLRQGIDRFYGYNCQALAHNYYPTTLWDDNRRVNLNNPEFSAHQKLPAGANAADPAAYAGFTGRDYSPDLIADQARAFVRANRDRPFFLYWPTTVPHLALQVSEDSLQEYLGQFPEVPYQGDRGYLPHRTPLAAYAAMITRFDREIGRLLALLDELGLAGNTLIVFTSDNGPLAGPLLGRLGGTDADFFVSAGPLRNGKATLHEGGIRVPMIIRWPGRIAPATTSEQVTGFEDWLPTLLDLIGRPDLTPAHLDGISFAPVLRGEKQAPRPFLYREFPNRVGQQCVRLGDWKGVRQDLQAWKGEARTEPPMELYNLATDIGEKTNVAAQHPDIVARIVALMREQHVPSKDFPLPGIDVAGPPGG